jgi:hypothetical protein
MQTVRGQRRESQRVITWGETDSGKETRLSGAEGESMPIRLLQRIPTSNECHLFRGRPRLLPDPMLMYRRGTLGCHPGVAILGLVEDQCGCRHEVLGSILG